jgi:hypothetical protein
VQGVLTEADPERVDGAVVPGVTDEGETSSIPMTFLLEQNAPNPFNTGTVIGYRLPVLAHVMVRIYDLTGQEVCTLVDRVEVAGVYQVRWDGQDAQGREVASGVYLIRLQAETVSQWTEERKNFAATRKMVLMR